MKITLFVRYYIASISLITSRGACFQSQFFSGHCGILCRKNKLRLTWWPVLQYILCFMDVSIWMGTGKTFFKDTFLCIFLPPLRWSTVWSRKIVGFFTIFCIPALCSSLALDLLSTVHVYSRRLFPENQRQLQRKAKYWIF